jgi:hypothetical protein
MKKKEINAVLVVVDELIVDLESVNITAIRDAIARDHLERAKLRASVVRRELDSILFNIELKESEEKK